MTSDNTTNAPEMVTPLPCPFCGGDELSHGWESPGVNGSPSTGTVQCHNCNALVFAEPSEADAITAWNTRAPVHQSASPSGLVEALESIVEYWNRDRNDMAMHDACWHAINTAEAALAALTAAPATAGEGEGSGAKIIAGLEDAVAYQQGDHSRGRAHHVRVATPSASGEAIERVARAIAVAMDDDEERYWPSYRVEAEAAIVTLLNPNTESGRTPVDGEKERGR